MTYINNTIMLIEDEIAGNMSNEHSSKIQDKKIWKSLRTHILSRREKNKQVEAEAETLRKQKCAEYQKMQENKLSLAQINGRLSQLRYKRDELELEKRALLNESQNTSDTMSSSSIVPKIELNCEPVNNKLVTTNNTNNSIVSNHRSNNLYQQHIYRPQNTLNAESSGIGSPQSGSGLSPLPAKSLMMYNSNTNAGSGNQTLLVCSPSTINSVAANQNNVTRSISATCLSDPMTYTKCSSLYNSNTNQLIVPNVETSNKMSKIPSPQPIEQQNYQQIIPFPTYKSMNSSISNLNSTTTTPVVNNINQSLVTAANRNYTIENSNRRGIREETSQLFNRNIWINNNSNNANKNAQPNASNYGSFYQPTSTAAVNYCVNNITPSTSSLSSVNTIYSYSGTTPQTHLTRTELSSISNLMTSTSADPGPPITKPITSHQQFHHHQIAPMFMSPGIRNSNSNNHSYHSKPSHGYPDERMNSPAPNFYHQHGTRNVHLPNTTTVQSQPHQMNQKLHNIGFPIRHPNSTTTVSVHSSAAQLPQHAPYNGPTTSSATTYSNNDISKYQQVSQTSKRNE